MSLDDTYDEPNAHYKRTKFDTHDVVEEWFKDWPGKAATAYYLGGALKYIQRAGHKEGEPILKDLKKALYYITKAVASVENKT